MRLSGRAKERFDKIRQGGLRVKQLMRRNPESRPSTHKNAILLSDHDRFNCVIKDLTHKGAYVAGVGVQNVEGNNIELVFDGQSKQVHIAWRKSDCVGVKFL